MRTPSRWFSVSRVWDYLMAGWDARLGIRRRDGRARLNLLALEARVVPAVDVLVNQTTVGIQSSPAVASDADGDYIVVWVGDNSYGIYGRLYAADGMPRGGEFRIDTSGTEYKDAPSVAMDADGDFVVAWTRYDSPTYEDVYARAFYANGTARGADFRVNATYTGWESNPSVAMDSDGDFVVAWSWENDGYGSYPQTYGISAQRYAANGTPQGSEIQATPYTAWNRSATVGMDGSGNFVIAWQSDDADGEGIFARRYAANGSPSSSVFPVNSYTTGDQGAPSVDVNGDGDFVVAWESYGQGGTGYHVYLQQFSSAGTAQGGEVRVDTYTLGDSRAPSVAMDADGNFVVAWSAFEQDGSGWGVVAQRYSADGTARDANVRVNNYTTNDQQGVAVSLDRTGRLVVAWEGEGPGDNNGIFLLGAGRPLKAPPELCPTNASDGPVRYFDGVVVFGQTDLASDGFGTGLTQSRSWTNGAGYAPQNTNGAGTVSAGQPYILRFDGGDTLAVVRNGTRADYFELSSATWVQQFYGKDRITHDAVNREYVLVDEAGGVTRFHDFSLDLPAGQRGRLKESVDAAGNVTTVSYTADGLVEEVTRSATVGAGLLTESMAYTYLSGSDPNAGLVATVTLRRKVGAGAWQTARSVEYSYYDGVEEHGNRGDLKTVTVKDATGAPTDTKYFRYYVAGEAGGYAGGLKLALEGDAVARLTADLGNDLGALTDEDVAPYADLYLEYDDARRVTREVVQGAGCSVCSAGQGEYTFTYTASGNGAGVNSWAAKTVETLPDGNQNVVYTNAFGQVMLKVYVDTTTSQEWATYFRYDADGRLLLQAEPSAVSGYDDAYADLVHFVSNDAEYLRDDAGLVNVYTYYSATTATDSVAGGADGYQQGTAIRNGEFGDDVPQSLVDYFAHTDGDGVTVYQVATSTVFRDDAGLAPITTTYAYTYFSGTNAVASVETTLPVVDAGQNGSGVASILTTVYDSYGRAVWSKDAAGVVTYTEYDQGTGAVVKLIADVDTDNTGDFAGLPSGWSSPNGFHLITTFEVDELGRATKQIGPDGMVMYTIYNDAAHEVRVYSAWNDATDAPTGPTYVTREDRARGYTETLAMTATPALDSSGRPTGNETIAGLVSLSRSYVNDAGQMVRSDAYFHLNGLTYTTGSMGVEGTDFYSIEYVYDSRGRLAKTVSPSGTINRTEYDGMGRVVSEWVGTDDTPTTGFWSPTNLAGTNMVQVSAYVYDGGGVGDSLLTETTLFTHTAAAPDQTTQYAYDWRGRTIGSKSGVQVIEGTDVNRPITLVDYDNLGQTTRTRVYDGDGVALVDGNGTLQVPGGSLLRAQTHASYDDLGRVYKSEVDNVNQANGTVGTYSLNSQTWYDERGLVRKQTTPSSAISKSVYDSLGRLTIAYTTDGQNGGNYTQALSVSDDVVLEQTEYVYDNAGRVIQTISRQRFHDATGNGPLGNATGSQPKARVYNVGYFYDLAGRPTNVVNVGTNGNAAWTLPGSVPGRSDTVLVMSTSYGADGRVQDVTDARGIVSRSLYDALGRTIQTVEDFGGINKTTLYTYGPAGMTSLTAVNASTGNQTTEWVFGVTTAGGSGLNSNDVVGQTRHPDPATGAASGNQTDTVTVSALGQTLSTTNRNGTVHAFNYDAIGRLTRDTATTLGNGIDGVVRRQEFRYDTLGQTVLATQYDATSSGNVTSQVQREYNGFGQLTVEYQAIGGSVDLGNTPKVQYGYSEAANGTNHSRLVSITYPNGRELDYVYGSANGTDDRISRLTAIADSSGTLEAYGYLGLATVVVRSHPQPGIDLSYVLQTPEAFGDAGDQYNGLDRFGRVVDQRWVDSGNGTAVNRFQYGYDRNSNRLWRDNLNNATFGEIYAYDDLGQLVGFDRGTLNGNRTGLTGNATRSQSWDLDPLGNWDGVTTNGTTETREHNAQNEVVGVGNATLAFDAAGNMLTDEQGQQYRYDAWNRLVKVTNSGNATIAEYGYDALRRRTEETHGNTTTELYYSSQWQVLEERDAATGNTTMEYTWSPVYVDAMIERDRDTDGNGSRDERLWVQQDANWNVTSIVDGNGNVVERYIYDAYGSDIILSEDFSDARLISLYGQAYLWQSRPIDSVTRLYDNRGRWYDPMLGRPINSDPLGLAPDVNSYRWEYGSPVNFVDPSGQLVLLVPILIPAVSALTETVIIGGTAAAVAGGSIAAGEALSPRPTGYYAGGLGVGGGEQQYAVFQAIWQMLFGKPKPAPAPLPTPAPYIPVTHAADGKPINWNLDLTDYSTAMPAWPDISIDTKCDINSTNKKVCFASGTPMRTPDGWRYIENIKAGDLVLSRDENDANGEVLPKLVEEVFVNHGIVWHLHVGGQVIRTADEHPFWVRGRGWVPCNEVQVGDWLSTQDGTWARVDNLLNTGKYEALYNFRVADFHTYFVGSDEWGFSVWAHNTCVSVYHATSRSRAGKILGLGTYSNKVTPGFRPGYDGAFFLAEEASLALGFARAYRYGEGQTKPQKLTVIKFTLDEKLLNSLATRSIITNGFRGWEDPIDDFMGNSAYEWVVEGANIQRWNNAMFSGEIRTDWWNEPSHMK